MCHIIYRTDSVNTDSKLTPVETRSEIKAKKKEQQRNENHSYRVSGRSMGRNLIIELMQCEIRVLVAWLGVSWS
jgi:hypothetical protein